MKRILPENLKAISDVIKDDIGEIIAIIDLSSHSVGMFWTVNDNSSVEYGSFRHGYCIGPMNYELSKEEAQQFKAHILGSNQNDRRKENTSLRQLHEVHCIYP